jgi:mRNA degradation ribonuclease J1/J2
LLYNRRAKPAIFGVEILGGQLKPKFALIRAEDGEDVLSGATEVVMRLAGDASLSDKALQDRIKDKLSEYVYHETKRRPMIIPVLS